ncbi:MAG: tol-pal system-associated acyl-CoA thioesterase [Pseudomonadota bacterium]
MANFTLPVRVYIEDTDAGGIVYYVNYLKYCERARSEYFRTLGFDKPAFLEQGHFFVVTEANTKYHAPARLDDELNVTATVIETKRVSLLFEQLISRENQRLVSSQVRIAYLDHNTMKPKAIPLDVLNSLT